MCMIARPAMWVMPQTWMSHVAHVNESCHNCNWVTSCSVWRDIIACETWLIYCISSVRHDFAWYYVRLWVIACPAMCGKMNFVHTIHHTHVLDIWHMYLSHVNESCHTCNWVMSFTLWRDSFRKNKVSSTQYMTHMYLKYDTHVLESCQWVMSRMRLSCVY